MSNDWIDEVSRDCMRARQQEDVARELFEIALRHSPSIFERLTSQMNFDIAYFRQKCQEASHLLAVKSQPDVEFKVWTTPPYSSEVVVTPFEAHIAYTKIVGKNPRAKPTQIRGQFLVRANYSQSVWLEHEGEDVTTECASRILLVELFQTVAKPER